MVADALASGDAEIARLRSTLGDAASRSSHQIVDLARSLVAVPSAYPPGNTHAVADRIEAMFKGSGAEVSAPKRPDSKRHDEPISIDVLLLASSAPKRNC
jgi:hypothetical protein